MPEVTKDFTIDVPLEEAWEFFVDPEKIAPCVPGCESYEELEEDVFEAVVSVKVAYTKLTFDTHVEITHKEEPSLLRVEGSGEPSGRMPGSATVEGELEFDEDNPDVTEGTIHIDFAIRGRLGSLGESAFRHKCDDLTETFLENAKTELEGGEE